MAEPPAAEGPAADSPVADAGMQAERTRLAWGRTALAMAVIGALELHVGRSELALINRLPGAVMLLAAVGCWAYGGRRYVRVYRTLLSGGPIVGRRHGPVLVLLAVLPAIIAVWAVLT